jgi:hypothetical protein
MQYKFTKLMAKYQFLWKSEFSAALPALSWTVCCEGKTISRISLTLAMKAPYFILASGNEYSVMRRHDQTQEFSDNSIS